MDHDSQNAEQPGIASRLAVVGRAEAISAFAAAGLKSCPAEPGPAATEQVAGLVRDGYRVIFFTEDLLPDLAPLLERHRHDATPCLVPLPVGGSRAGMDRLRDIVRRAVGADVFGDATERSQ